MIRNPQVASIIEQFEKKATSKMAIAGAISLWEIGWVIVYGFSAVLMVMGLIYEKTGRRSHDVDE
jgi:hypothetical protein